MSFSASKFKTRVAISTLGCKVNQVESAAILEELENKGLRPVSFKKEADIYIVNTCAVTARAAYESRQLLRRALKKNPLLVVGTGCYVQVFYKEILARINRPLLLVGNTHKHKIPQILEDLSLPLKASIIKRGEILLERECQPFLISRFFHHARAFVRIQDGCSSFCSYCLVPLARGPARSLSSPLVLKQIKNLLKNGYQEIVLTGIHLGLWGKDLENKDSLPRLLFKIEDLKPPRIRLSSIEPTELTPELLTWAKKSSSFCPHFHLPLQSADDTILQVMRRPYRKAYFKDLIWEIKSIFPQAAIGVDVLVGFPGESKKSFQKTYEYLQELPISYLHVFPFSPRPFTWAFKQKQIPPHEIARRVKILKELSFAKRKAFYLENLGLTRSVIVQGLDSKIGLYKGLTDNYIPVWFEGREKFQGKRILVKLERLINDRLYGKVVNVEEGE